MARSRCSTIRTAGARWPIWYGSQDRELGFDGGGMICSHASVPPSGVRLAAQGAQDAYDFFVAFFDAFPQYKSNPFYLTSESYGGVYIPLFMDMIDKMGGIPNFKVAISVRLDVGALSGCVYCRR
eukprot:scaffold723_cov363-Prasinococcus_capsulatus_cf.AAC.14